MNEIIQIIIYSLVSIMFLFIISKLLGKKQIAQLEFIDYTIGISLGSIAAEMATETETPWFYYIIAMSIFFLLDIAISYLGRLTPWLKKFFKGQPIMVIKDGKFDYKQLKKSKLDVNDVVGLCRTQGYFDINDVAYAIFEINGQLSVLPRGSQKPTVVSDFNIPSEQSSLSNYVIVDGVVVNQTLKQLGKNQQWLFNKLNINHKKQLKNIILCGYDEKLDKMDVHYKMLDLNKNINQQKKNKEKTHKTIDVKNVGKINLNNKKMANLKQEVSIDQYPKNKTKNKKSKKNKYKY